MNLSDRYQRFHTSVYAGMYGDLADALGITVAAIMQLGIGYDYKYQAWVIPERNVFGDIIGLSYRYADGRKTMAPLKSLSGSSKNRRGLIYPFNQHFDSGVQRYNPGKHNWIRIADAGVRCPICDKPDWCLVSAENPSDPQAVLCKRIEEGSVKETEGGFLHIRKSGGRLTAAAKLVLPPSDMPLIIVEGASDVLAALSLGFIAIGRPNCGACTGLLSRMPLAGREVWIIGENDAGAGITGMEETFSVVKRLTSDVKMFLPENGIKDLRAWYNAGLTCEELIEYAYEHGSNRASGDIDVFEDAQPTTIADALVAQSKYDGKPTRVIFNDKHYKWNGTMYQKMQETELQKEVLDYMVGKKITVETTTGSVVKPLPTTAKWARDVLYCLPRSCPLLTEEGWIANREDRPPVDQLISFQNGILDVGEYIESGNIKMYDSDPDLFVLGSFPYAYDSNAECSEFEKFFLETQDDDKDMLRLLSQWAGYLLVPDMSLEKMAILYNQRRSGKGTVLECLKHLIGDDLCTSVRLVDFSSQFGLHCMEGKLHGVFGDERAPRANEANQALGYILCITGGDAVNIDRKYRDMLSNVYLKIRFTMAANDLPRFSDDSMAFAARALPFRFDISYEGREDYSLKKRMKQHAIDGHLINWALRGLRDLRQEGRFSIPEKARAIIEEIRGINSQVRAFVSEMCDLKLTGFVQCSLLYKVWKQWCEDQGIRPGSRDSFGRKLSSAYPEVKRRCVRLQKGKANFSERSDNRSYAYEGLALNDEALTEILD